MKKNIAIVFGGQSPEHEVSIKSARNVYNALDKNRYRPFLIGITTTGQWVYAGEGDRLLSVETLDDMSLEQLEATVSVDEIIGQAGKKDLVVLSTQTGLQIEVAFPVLHGPYGEDGTIQGFLKTVGIPFVGPDVLSSAVSMDKEVMKRLLVSAGLPIGEYLVLHSDNPEDKNKTWKEIQVKLGEIVFVKPANMGSSVGIHRVTNQKEWQEALDDAWQYDPKLIVEKNINGRELECAILGNESPQASVVGELITGGGFYSYDNKYIDGDATDIIIPAPLDDEIITRIQTMAIKVFQTLGGAGLARVDFFLTEADELFVIEMNTIPGFTDSSMYPSLWAESGIDNTDLISKLIELALARQKQIQSLKTRR